MADRLTEAAKQGDNQTVCDARMIRRWENGDVIWPQEKYRILLERVFGKPASELGFVQLESILASQTVASTRATITPDATGLPTGDAIVVCGPKSAPVGAWLLDRDPCLGMIEDRGQWSLLDRITGERHPSPSDIPDYPSRDIAYLARHLIDGRTILHIAGIHAIGPLGMVHYLTRNLIELSSTFGDEPFSLAAISDYDGLTITGAALFLGPHRWRNA